MGLNADDTKSKALLCGELSVPSLTSLDVGHDIGRDAQLHDSAPPSSTMLCLPGSRSWLSRAAARMLMPCSRGQPEKRTD